MIPEPSFTDLLTQLIGNRRQILTHQCGMMPEPRYMVKLQPVTKILFSSEKEEILGCGILQVISHKVPLASFYPGYEDREPNPLLVGMFVFGVDRSHS